MVFWKQQKNCYKTLWDFFSSQKAGLVQININVIWLGKLTIVHFRYKCEVLEELR